MNKRLACVLGAVAIAVVASHPQTHPPAGAGGVVPELASPLVRVTVIIVPTGTMDTALTDTTDTVPIVTDTGAHIWAGTSIEGGAATGEPEPLLGLT